MKAFLDVTHFDWFMHLLGLPIRSRRFKLKNEDVILLVFKFWKTHIETLNP